MASPSDHGRRHADLLSRARGARVLSNEEKLCLQQRGSARKNKKLHFFNSEDGWMLRRSVRAHPVQQAPKQFCALRGIHTGDAKKLRARLKSRCVGPVSSTSDQYRTSKSQNYHAFRLGKTWNGFDQEHTRLVLPAVELPLKMNRSQQGLVHRREHPYPL